MQCWFSDTYKDSVGAITPSPSLLSAHARLLSARPIFGLLLEALQRTGSVGVTHARYLLFWVTAKALRKLKKPTLTHPKSLKLKKKYLYLDYI